MTRSLLARYESGCENFNFQIYWWFLGRWDSIKTYVALLTPSSLAMRKTPFDEPIRIRKVNIVMSLEPRRRKSPKIIIKSALMLWVALDVFNSSSHVNIQKRAFSKHAIKIVLKSNLLLALASHRHRAGRGHRVDNSFNGSTQRRWLHLVCWAPNIYDRAHEAGKKCP